MIVAQKDSFETGRPMKKNGKEEHFQVQSFVFSEKFHANNALIMKLSMSHKKFIPHNLREANPRLTGVEITL